MSERVGAEVAAAVVSGIPIVGPIAGVAVRRLAEASITEIARLQSRSLRAAALVAGVSREELWERINNDPRLVPLVVRVLHEAGMTGQDEVLDALGAALGAAVIQPERSDEVEVILLGIGRVRRPHIRVLRHLEDDKDAYIVDDNGHRTSTNGRWQARGIAHALGLTGDEAARLCTDLAGAGFCRQEAALGGMTFEVTDLGHALLTVLAAREQQAD
jgi:hypothetical protein